MLLDVSDWETAIWSSIMGFQKRNIFCLDVPSVSREGDLHEHQQWLTYSNPAVAYYRKFANDLWLENIFNFMKT
jgi:hypothetical protein